MRSVIATACLAVALSLPATVCADEMTLGQYKERQHDELKEFINVYLAGVTTGLVAYNSYLISERKAPMFCAPMKLSITTEQASDIMIRWAKSKPADIDTHSVSTVLMLALIDTFPCPK